MTYFITNKQDKPINVIHDGNGPHIQFLKNKCESYPTPEAAEKRLMYLSGYTRSNPCIKNLKVSTFAKGFMI
jgi:hypothetical protein